MTVAFPASVKRSFSSASRALARSIDSAVVSIQPAPMSSPVRTLPVSMSSSCYCMLACSCLHQAMKRPGADVTWRWLDKTVQPKAKELLGSPVINLENISSYVCRNRYDSPNQPLSEHALANALDVSGFVLASGEHITVLDSWPKVVSTPPAPVPNPGRETVE